MNYRLCEKCGGNYSTGKNYEDEFGDKFALDLLKGIDSKTVEIKGVCPLCNPKSMWYNKNCG